MRWREVLGEAGVARQTSSVRKDARHEGDKARFRFRRKNGEALQRLLKAAAGADEARGTNLTNLSHSERMKALFGKG